MQGSADIHDDQHMNIERLEFSLQIMAATCFLGPFHLASAAERALSPFRA
jgi:hypothetical protein